MERLIRICVFVSLFLPFSWLVYAAAAGALGPDPAEAIMHETGEWATWMLLLTLLATPLRRWTGRPVVIKLRRMLGLYTFFYGTVHLLTFAHFYIGWTPSFLLEELVERPYVLVGFSAWCLMLPLAFTSTKGMQRRLRKNWQRLHKLIYPAAILVSCHILWQARSDIGEALLYIVLFGFLLGWRMVRARNKSLARAVPG